MSTWGQGGTRAWRRVRQTVLERDNYECQLQFPGCTFTATEAHHQTSIAATMRARAAVCEEDDASDCIAACRSCHAQVTERQRRAAQMRLNAARRARMSPPAQPHPGAR